jgi:hypothetical protein
MRNDLALAAGAAEESRRSFEQSLAFWREFERRGIASDFISKQRSRVETRLRALSVGKGGAE